MASSVGAAIADAILAVIRGTSSGVLLCEPRLTGSVTSWLLFSNRASRNMFAILGPLATTTFASSSIVPTNRGKLSLPIIRSVPSIPTSK